MFLVNTSCRAAVGRDDVARHINLPLTKTQYWPTGGIGVLWQKLNVSNPGGANGNYCVLGEDAEVTFSNIPDPKGKNKNYLPVGSLRIRIGWWPGGK